MLARIRTIKPEFWGDEKLAPLDPLTRLVFLGLISMADDAGRLLDNVKSIDGFLFPETDDTSRVALDTLARLSRISRYTVASGARIIQVANWPKHQKVDKPSTYVLPPETVATPSRDSGETLDESSRSDLGPRTVEHGPTTLDRGGGSAPARVISVAEPELEQQCGDAYPDIAKFLAARPSHLRDEWAADLLQLIGPLTGNLPADLARACRDGKLADPPVTNAKTLRIFVASCRDERRRAEQEPVPGTLKDSLAAWVAEGAAKEAANA